MQLHQRDLPPEVVRVLGELVGVMPVLAPLGPGPGLHVPGAAVASASGAAATAASWETPAPAASWASVQQLSESLARAWVGGSGTTASWARRLQEVAVVESEQHLQQHLQQLQQQRQA